MLKLVAYITIIYMLFIYSLFEIKLKIYCIFLSFDFIQSFCTVKSRGDVPPPSNQKKSSKFIKKLTSVKIWGVEESPPYFIVLLHFLKAS